MRSFPVIIACLVCTSAEFTADGQENSTKAKTHQQFTHAELVDRANAIVAKRAEKVALDPLRPTFHIMTPAHWCNDPHGILFYEGKYHLFLQHDIYFHEDQEPVGRGWGHLASDDFVYWQPWPIALVPGPHEYDDEGIWSGGSFIDNSGVPTIIYSSRPHCGQCMAKSYDGMKTWVKHERNPVLNEEDIPPESRLWMRDPTFFKTGETINMLIGSPWWPEDGHGRGTVLLFQSTDAIHWKYRHQICQGRGSMWECANMLPVGEGKHVLFVSDNPGGWLNRLVKYSVGTWNNEKFEMGQWKYFDWGERVPYAPGGFVDQQGRAIALGYIGASGLASSPPWANCLSLPRELKLRKNGRLGMEPLPELKQLRGEQHKFAPFTLNEQSPNVLEDIQSNTCEIVIELENINAEQFGFELLRSADGQTSVPVVYSTLTKVFTVGSTTGPFMQIGGEVAFQLRIFVDKTIVEMFASGRDVFSAGGITENPDNLGMRLFAVGGSVKVNSLAVYELDSIWKN